jgi:hypothetical protein
VRAVTTSSNLLVQAPAWQGAVTQPTESCPLAPIAVSPTPFPADSWYLLRSALTLVASHAYRADLPIVSRVSNPDKVPSQRALRRAARNGLGTSPIRFEAVGTPMVGD